MKRVVINIGELAVSKEPASLETILGSCVAVCLWDPQRRIGGLNHYLLPCEQRGAEKSTLYGRTSIDTLIAQIVAMGAEIGTLRAQIFGGGTVISALEGLFNIGDENIFMAQERLRAYGIPIVGAHVRNTGGIRVVVKTATGQIKVTPLGADTSLATRESATLCRLVQPCKTCIICGSCEEIMNKRKKGSKKHDCRHTLPSRSK